MAAPNLTVTVEPNESGKLVYLPLAPKTKDAAPNGQLSLRLSIKNNESRKVRMKTLTLSFVGPPQVADKTIPLQVTITEPNKPPVTKDLEIDAGQTATWFFLPKQNILLPDPAPATIKLGFTCEGFDTAVSVSFPLARHQSPTPEHSYPFPAKASDLRVGEYWNGRSAVHGAAGGGTQIFAYDMDVVAWDANAKVWTNLLPGKDKSKNDSYRIYGKPLYAVADGTVVAFKNDMPENTQMGAQDPTPSPVEGNHFYLQHGDELFLYAHLQPGSLNSKLMKTGAAVKRGDFLGLAGNSGNSTNPHLHIHVIQATQPWKGPSRPLPFNSIHVVDPKALQAPDPSGPWVKVDDQGLPSDPALIWPAATAPAWYPPGWAELARHGIPEASYQVEFERITSSGYRLVWIDGYEVNGQTFFNVIFRPANGTPWVARHGLTGAGYQKEFDERMKEGFRLVHIESYLHAGQVRYAPIFEKASGPLFVAYHGRTANEHQKLFDDLTKQGWRPINLPVVSVNGQRLHAGLYEKRDVGSFFTKNVLTPAEYQQHFDANVKAGRELVYINAYTHLGAPRFTAIWHEKGRSPFVARHGLTSQGYQTEFDKNLASGFLTRGVTGYEESDGHRFAAFWSK